MQSKFWRDAGNHQMTEALEIIFTKTWWTWDPRDDQWFSLIYHWFNIGEGAAWAVLAGLVFGRYLKYRRSWLEIGYSVTFLTFALTDFREAWEQSSWLIWLKLVNLVVLLCIRRVVMRRWYPEASIY